MFNTLVPLGFYSTGMISPIFLAPFFYYQAQYLRSVMEFKTQEGSVNSAKKLKRTAYAPFIVLLMGFMSSTAYNRYQKRRSISA